MTPLISVICPVRNEQASIDVVFNQLHPLGAPTELLFIEGSSTDQTWSKVESLNNKSNRWGVKFRGFKQSGRGKSGAVATGFDRSLGKYLIILDADLTVTPADAQKIISLFSEYGDNIIASGNRLRGLPKPDAFYWINYFGNYFFRYYYSAVIGTPVLDISCGSKAMTKSTWQKVKALREKEGHLDSWGDIDWLYYGHKSGCQIKYVTIDYQKRLLGTSKLQNHIVRWRFAWNMFTIGLHLLQKSSPTD